ncbi:host specificity protein J [Stutzerimonas stutzeri]|uniref:host specificity protein J n=1 Tax=Stutzerimonas stutzeri TaxID=316 RepID=UPI002109F32A|nr:phage tail protein [Stutzerimonas stutzeri]MCQ4257487.1 phage tail protein [Stutzerimonas stutzeri]
MTAAVLDNTTGQVRRIAGRKGGEKTPRSPVIAPDSVRSTAYAKVLLALGEGEFAADANGQLDGRNIYLDGTPLLAADGTENFPGVKWEFRPGTPHQEHIAGLPAVENETALGVELRSGAPLVRAISNSQLSAVRVRVSWPMLQQQQSNGDVVGYRIDYAIDLATDGGSYVEVATYTLNDKVTSKYERTHRIDLPTSATGWQLRVRRLTANQNNPAIADTMRVEAITEVIDAKLRYPNTALLFVQFDASQFSGIPQVAVETRGRIVRVPSNYEPSTRSYSGIWDGTFKWAWTDNPAWVWYDILLGPRFGLGRRLNAAQVDKWELYRIAQYCDQLVPDGKGGTEPRFTCNVYFQKKADAWVVLRDLAAIFRGMGYWANSQMVAMADMPRDVDYQFTRANVVDGKFSYTGGSQKARHSMALVSFDDPENGYQSDVEPVANNALVRRYGVNQVEVSAIGCTRRSEANRRGQWLLLTNKADRSVNFRVGLDGIIPLPGRIIAVADELLAGRVLGGRISAVAGRQITLDRDALVNPGDRLVLNLPNGTAEGRTVESVAARVVTVTTAYSQVPRAQSAWTLDAADLTFQQYRVLRVGRPEPGQFEISAVQHDPAKYAAIDTGARLEDRPISVRPAGVQVAPANVTVTSTTRVVQGLAVTTLRAGWDAAPGAVAYEAEWRKDDGQWLAVPRGSAQGFEVPGIYAGRYLVRVRAINPMDVASLPAYSQETQLNGKEGAPPAVAFLTATPLLFGIGLAWGFPPEGAADTQRTEIQYNTSPAVEGAMHLGDYAYPANGHTMLGLKAGVTFHFRARLVDRTGNVGPWSDWVMGQSSSDATPILEAVAGQIGDTELGQHIKDRLDLIDGTGPGSVNERLQSVVDVLAYVSTKAYASGETVRQGQRLYQATQAVPVETPPPNAAYWLDIGQVVQQANALAGQVSQNTTAIEQTEQGLQAQSERLDGVFAQVNPPLAGDTSWNAGSTTVMAGVWSEQSARASEDMALGRRIDTVTAQVGDNTALIRSEQTARADAVSALAKRVDTVVAELGEDLRATVEQTSEVVAGLDGKLQAMYSVKLGVTSGGQYYAAGMGIGIENTPEGMQSQVLFQADRFAVINVANGQITTPFVIQGGQVFINSAVIGEGTIGMAQIATALQSTDYVAGSQGWRLDKAGTFEINGSVPGQGRMQMTHRALKFWDGNNVLRVQAGDLTA